MKTLFLFFCFVYEVMRFDSVRYLRHGNLWNVVWKPACFPVNLVIFDLNISVKVFQILMCSTQVKIQEKHLLPLLVLLSEMSCNIPRAKEMTRVDYKCMWSLCLVIYSSNLAFTYTNVIICGRKSKSIPTSVINKVPVASSSAYLMFKKCSDRTCWFK